MGSPDVLLRLEWFAWRFSGFVRTGWIAGCERFARVGLGQRRIGSAPFFGPLAIAIATPESAAAALRTRNVIFLVALRPRVLVDQRLAVGDGNLVIIGMDFGERKKSVPVAPVVDECRLERRFDSHDFREIDSSTKLFFTGGFEI